MSKLKHESRYRKWIAFYRENPHRLVRDYFGIKLYPMQELLFVLMHKYPTFAFIACRGISKSFTVALYAFTMCVLYPGYKVVLTSGTKGQAKKIIVDKIQKEFVNRYPDTMGREILSIRTGNEPEAVFRNGSYIVGAPPTDNARGARAIMNVYDECRMIKKNIIDDVFEPMKNGAIRLVDSYSKLLGKDIEDPAKKTIYMTSGYYKSNWTWAEIKSIYDDMYGSFKEGREPFGTVVSVPYHIGIMYKMITRTEILKKKRGANADPIAFLMEYEGEFVGESGQAFFKLDMFDDNRELSRPFYLSDTINIELTGKDDLGRFLKEQHKIMPKVPGELRLMAVDVAPSLGVDSDNNVVEIVRLIPKNGYYERQFVNIKKLTNDVSSVHAKFIKRWFYAFECDQMALDVQGTSFSLFEELVKPTYDNDMDAEYPAWRVIDGNVTESKVDEYIQRTKDANADDVIYAISANAEFNHIIASKLRAALQEGNRISFLKPKEIANDEILERYNNVIDPLILVEKLEPFINTDAMINECVLLEGEKKENGRIKLSTSGSYKKDRYVTTAYLNHLASLYDSDLDVEDDDDWVCSYAD